VDLRGMGGSGKPAGGYDKKTMAADIRALTAHLGYERIDIAGHDIGSMVGYSFAANHPDAIGKLVMLDVAHPDASLNTLTLLPQPGQFFLWWFAFNQVDGLPEHLLAGRARLLVDWLFDHILTDPSSILSADRAIYAAAYNTVEAVRAGNGWYKAFEQDIADERGYQRLTTPVLALAAIGNYGYLSYLLPGKIANVTVTKVDNAGHYLPEEQPELVTRMMLSFLA
jgi:pimeloyl-ACP methyl ester carboxylesterase